MVDYGELFAHRAPLAETRTGLLLIDLQKASASRQHGLGAALARAGEAERGASRFDRIEQVAVPNARRLLDSFRRHRGQVFHLTLGSRSGDYTDLPPFLRALAASTENRLGGENHQILPEVEPTPGEPVLLKTTASAFASTDLHKQLQARSISALVIAGVSTNTCVESTARDAADRGYACVLAEDSCAAATRQLHDNAIAGFQRLFGRIASTSEVLAELGWDTLTNQECSDA